MSRTVYTVSVRTLELADGQPSRENWVHIREVAHAPHVAVNRAVQHYRRTYTLPRGWKRIEIVVSR